MDFGLWTLDLERDKPTTAASDKPSMIHTSTGVSRRPRREMYRSSRGQKATLRPMLGSSAAGSPASPPEPKARAMPIYSAAPGSTSSNAASATPTQVDMEKTSIE